MDMRLQRKLNTQNQILVLFVLGTCSNRYVFPQRIKFEMKITASGMKSYCCSRFDLLTFTLNARSHTQGIPFITRIYFSSVSPRKITIYSFTAVVYNGSVYVRVCVLCVVAISKFIV